MFQSKTGFNRIFKDYWCSKSNIHKFWYSCNKILEVMNSPSTHNYSKNGNILLHIKTLPKVMRK